MDTTNTTPMIYLKDLVFSIAYRWKRILAIALILAVAFALISWASDPRGSATAEKDAIAEEQYQRKKDILLSKIDVLTAGIEEKQDYLTDSILMQLDPRSYYEIALTIFVDTDYQILPEMSYQDPNMTAAVINSYTKLLGSKNAAKVISDAIGTESDYLTDIMLVLPDPVNQTITIQAQYMDKAGANKLADVILDYFNSLHEQISQSVSEHTCTVLSRDIYENDSTSLFDLQVAQLTALEVLEEDLDATELELANLRPPVISTTPYSAKDAIVPAGVGGVIGVFIMVAGIIIAFLADSKIYSNRTMRDRTNIKSLICARGSRKQTIDILWLRKLEGRVNATLEEQTPLLAANIRNRCGQGQLLISGSADPALVEQTAGYLSAALPEISVIFAGNILTDPAALSALPKCDCVVLIEQCHRTQYAQLNNAQELICDHNKALLGCILIDG